MAPYNASNKDAFDNKKGPGDIVSVLVHSRALAPVKDLQEYLSMFPGLERSKEGTGIPGLVHFVDKRGGLRNYPEPAGWRDIYVRKDSPASCFFIIMCGRRFDPSVYPSCNVRYFDSVDSGLPYLSYRYSVTYLQQWREIHEKLLALISSFRSNADKSGRNCAAGGSFDG